MKSCSYCGTVLHGSESHSCPNCGAQLDDALPKQEPWQAAAEPEPVPETGLAVSGLPNSARMLCILTIIYAGICSLVYAANISHDTFLYTVLLVGGNIGKLIGAVQMLQLKRAGYTTYWISQVVIIFALGTHFSGPNFLVSIVYALFINVYKTKVKPYLIS